TYDKVCDSLDNGIVEEKKMMN
ncbi:MAG: hypothetical protein RL273_1273, partial [Bacteroidota bacterium]